MKIKATTSLFITIGQGQGVFLIRTFCHWASSLPRSVQRHTIGQLLPQRMGVLLNLNPFQ